MAFFLRSCPRCDGTLATDSDRFGPYVFCLACGGLWDLGVNPETGASGVNNPISPEGRTGELNKEQQPQKPRVAAGYGRRVAAWRKEDESW